jgi:hypothetical protein
MAYIDGTTSGNIIAALYAVSGGSASTLLEQSSSVNIGTTMTWIDFQLPTPINVNTGTTYGIAIMGNVQVNLMENPGTGQRDHNAVSTYTNGFANPFGMIWGTDNTGAMSIYALDPSSSTPAPTSTSTPMATPTQTPSPTAAPPSSSTNLASFNPSTVFPATPAWLSYSYYAEPFTENIIIDSNVLYNGQDTIRLNNPNNYAGCTNGARESDGPQIYLSAGETVVFSVWMKTSSSTLGDNGNSQSGERIGIDFYDNQEDIGGTSRTDGTIAGAMGVGGSNTFVPWGTSTWTQVTISFVVPKTQPYGDQGLSNPEGFIENQQVTPTWFTPWVQALNTNDGGQAWFADPQLYINP